MEPACLVWAAPDSHTQPLNFLGGNVVLSGKEGVISGHCGASLGNLMEHLGVSWDLCGQTTPPGREIMGSLLSNTCLAFVRGGGCAF